MREYVSLQCDECKNLTYRTQRETRDTKKLALKKHCRFCRKHTPHTEKRK